MNKVFDNIIEELELHSFEFGTDTLPAHYVRLNEAIEIVKKEAEKYNNGWIPCSVYLPKEKDGRVLICCEDGNVMTGTHSEFDNDNEWYKGDMYGVGGSNVIAWQPLLPPYKPKGE